MLFYFYFVYEYEIYTKTTVSSVKSPLTVRLYVLSCSTFDDMVWSV